MVSEYFYQTSESRSTRRTKALRGSWELRRKPLNLSYDPFEYSDVRQDAPPLRSDAYADRSISALVELVSILSAGIDIDFKSYISTSAVRVIRSIGDVEVEIRKTMDMAKQRALDQRLDYMCRLVEVLLNAGASKSTSERTLLHVAAESHSIRMVKRFIDLPFATDRGETPLHSMVRISHSDPLLLV